MDGKQRADVSSVIYWLQQLSDESHKNGSISMGLSLRAQATELQNILNDKPTGVVPFESGKERIQNEL